jgi:hypothetical protein
LINEKKPKIFKKSNLRMWFYMVLVALADY